MRFGFMLDFRNPKRGHLPPPAFHHAMIAQTVRAEELGYGHVRLTEHHFTDDAYNPASLSMAAVLALRKLERFEQEFPCTDFIMSTAGCSACRRILRDKPSRTPQLRGDSRLPTGSF